MCAYQDSNWKIVSNKKLAITDKVIKNKKLKWSKFYYIWRTRETWARIVYYEWKILSEPNEKWIVLTKYLDRDIYKNPDRILIERELPISALVIF